MALPWGGGLGISHWGGGPGEDPGHAGGTMSLGWPGNRKSRRNCSLGREVWVPLLRLLEAPRRTDGW